MDWIFAQDMPIPTGVTTFPQWFLWALGVAVAALSGAAALAIRWTAKEVVIPMRNRHFEHLDKTEKSVSTLTTCMAEIGKDVDEIKTELPEVAKACRDSHMMGEREEWRQREVREREAREKERRKRPGPEDSGVIT